MNEYPDAVPVLRVTVAVPGLRDLYLASASPPEVVAVPSGALPHPSLLPPRAPTELERQALAWDAGCWPNERRCSRPANAPGPWP